jgi:hypothetical protein
MSINEKGKFASEYNAVASTLVAVALHILDLQLGFWVACQ